MRRLFVLFLAVTCLYGCKENASFNISSNNIKSWEQGDDTISLQMENSAARAFYAITNSNVGETILIFIEGIEISSPRVNEPISGGAITFIVDDDLRAKILPLLPPEKNDAP